VVEPNNSGFTDDDLQKHIDKAWRTASKDFYIGNYVARKLQYPLLVPVFPRSKTNWRIYTHSLDRDVMAQKDNFLERIDLQLLAMIQDANKRLKEKGHKPGKRVLMTGFSASGTFTNRFTLIHPDKVYAAAAGGINGLLMLPIQEIDNRSLNYPLGVNDLQTFLGQPFDYNEFKNTPQFYFMGNEDENDAVPYDDGYSEEERKLVYDLLGKEMLPQRWKACKNVYDKNNIKAKIKTYQGIGHQHPDKIKNEAVQFFKNTGLVNNLKNK